MLRTRRLILWFLIPFVIPVVALGWKYSEAFSYGYSADIPTLGWFFFYWWITGGLLGTAGVSIYLAKRDLSRKNLTAVISLFVCLGQISLACYLLSEEGKGFCEEVISWVAYNWLYVPFPHAAPTDTNLPRNFVTCIPAASIVDVRFHASKLSIKTGKGTLRTYSWEGGTRSISVVPTTRDEENQEIISEASYPSDLNDATARRKRRLLFDWNKHDDITKCRVLEQVRNFDSQVDADEWLKSELRKRSERVPIAYNNSGLVILWSKYGERDTLWIIVTQVQINRRYPKQFGIADDDKDFSVLIRSP